MNQPLLPPWIVFPVALALLLMLMGHYAALHRPGVDAARRRIRSAATVLMVFMIPLAAYGFGVVTPAQTRMFVFVWTLIPALLFMLILLAGLDMANNIRVHRREQAQLRGRLGVRDANRADAPGGRADAHG